MKQLLGEPLPPMPYKHPLITGRLRVFSWPVSNTGLIFSGLGCPNGCDFCATSHFFKRKHVRLLPTGYDFLHVIERYLALYPDMVFTIIDEDFLLNEKRARRFLELVRASGRTLSIFAFASVKAVSRFTADELLAMGINGLWIGYEGARSGYAKQQGRPVDELFRDLRAHGIGVLASMIVGLDYQT